MPEENSVIEQMQQDAEKTAEKMKDYVEGRGEVFDKPSPKDGSSSKKEDSKSEKKDETPLPKPDSADKDKDKDKDNEGKPTPPKPSSRGVDKTGVSSAYEEIPECDIYGNVKPKEKKAKKDRPTPPDHGKPVKSGNEKNIMEMFWKEFILASYDWCINAAVDSVLDIADIVLYGPKESVGSEPKEKTNVFAIGEKIRETTKEKMLKRKEVCNKAYEEIAQNLEKDKNGEKVTWTLLKREPKFFKELSAINKKSPEDRTKEEKEKLQAFQNIPTIMNKMMNIGIKSRELAIAAATCETAADKENGDGVSAKFSQDLIKLEKALKSKNSVDATKCIEDLEKEVADKNSTFDAIRAELSAIKQNIKASKYRASLNNIEKIQKISQEAADDPVLCEAKIKQREKMYFSAIEKERERINNDASHTISETFTNDLELLNSIIKSDKSSPEDKVETIKELLTKMDEQLDSSSPSQQKIKETLKKVSDVVNDSRIAPKDAIEKINEDVNEVIQINQTQNPKKYTVSKEFAEDLYDLEGVMKIKELTLAQKIAEITRIAASMSAELDDGDVLQKAIKFEVRKIQDTIASTANNESKLTSITESINAISGMNKANNPIIKKNKEYFTKLASSISENKAAIEAFQKSVVTQKGKKAKMNQANHSMKMAFIGGSANQNNQEYSLAEEFSSETMSQGIIQNVILESTRG